MSPVESALAEIAGRLTELAQEEAGACERDDLARDRAAPSPTIATLAIRISERLAVLDRVRPVLAAAIARAPLDQANSTAVLAVQITKAILRGE